MFVPSVTARNWFQFTERLLVYFVQFLRMTNVHAEQRIIYGAVKVEKSYEEACLARFVQTRGRRNSKRCCFLSGIVINRWQRAMHEGRSLEVVGGVGNFFVLLRHRAVKGMVHGHHVPDESVHT